MGDDDDERNLTLSFLEDYAPEEQAPPQAASTDSAVGKAAPARRRRRPGLKGPKGPGIYWIWADSVLAVAEHALRALGALRADEWQPPHWLYAATHSRVATVSALARRLEKVHESWQERG